MKKHFIRGIRKHWGLPPQTPTREMISLDPSPADTTWCIKTTCFPLLLRKDGKTSAVLLLARPLKAANPDALHPGKAWE